MLILISFSSEMSAVDSDFLGFPSCSFQSEQVETFEGL